MGDLLKIEHLDCYHHNKQILKDISFSLGKGEVLAIVGPSGSGKSTLLRAIAMISPPSKAKILYRNRLVFPCSKSSRNKDYHDYIQSIGMVFQELYLWPHLSVMENITLPLIKGKRLTAKESKCKAEEILSKLSLIEFADRYPNKLSVGQQQRCAIARTLAGDPEILLLDEITSALDPELVTSILDLIKKIADDPNRTLVIVTHQMDFAKKVCNRIGCIDEGKLVALGTPSELTANSNNQRIQQYLQ